MKFARHEAAKAWCQPTTKNIEMIPELAEAFAEIIHEIKARIEMDGKLDYRTVDSEEAKLIERLA